MSPTTPPIVPAEQGDGAWTTPGKYYLGMTIPADDWDEQRTRWATIAFQNELIARGYLARPEKPLDGFFGPATSQAVKRFQKDCAATADGIIGPSTARRLFAPKVWWWQANNGRQPIPANLLLGTLRLESGLDPAAEGYVEPDDRGIGQFNREAFPDITDQIAYSNIPFCIMRAADTMLNRYTSYKTEFFKDLDTMPTGTAAEKAAKKARTRMLWDCVVAGHNRPTDARKWARDGKPPTERIAYYVELVRDQAEAAL